MSWLWLTMLCPFFSCIFVFLRECQNAPVVQSDLPAFKPGNHHAGQHHLLCPTFALLTAKISRCELVWACFVRRYFGFDAGDPTYDAAGAAAHLNKQFGKLATEVRKQASPVYRRRRGYMGKRKNAVL